MKKASAFLILNAFFLLFSFHLSYAEVVVPDAEPQKTDSKKEDFLFKQKMKEVRRLIKEEKWTEAQKMGREMIPGVSGDTEKQELFQLLREARFQMLFTKKQTDTSLKYEVQPGDSLGKIAKKYGTTIELLRKANKIKKDVVWAGMKLKIEKTPFAVDISIPKNVLWLKQGEHFVKKYSVSTGATGNTPVGTFKITNKIIKPTWYYDNKVIPAGDPKNGLGSRWMGFDLKGYGIHGTIEPQKIGKPASLGCVRMHNEDVEELFDLIPAGTPVTIHK